MSKEANVLFNMDTEFADGLDKEEVSEQLDEEFKSNRISLSCNTSVLIERERHQWLIMDRDKHEAYAVRKEEDALDVISKNEPWILFAEDQPDKNVDVYNILKDDYVVDLSMDAGETYEKLRDNRYDLLILDIMIPLGSLTDYEDHIEKIHADGAGITVLNWLRKSDSDRQTPATVPVVVITAIPNEDDINLVKNLLLPEAEWAPELMEEDWAKKVPETGWAGLMGSEWAKKLLEKERLREPGSAGRQQRKAEALFFLKPYRLLVVQEVVDKILGEGQC